MPTFVQQVAKNQIIIKAGVAGPNRDSGKTYRAIVDTGAK